MKCGGKPSRVLAVLALDSVVPCDGRFRCPRKLRKSDDAHLRRAGLLRGCARSEKDCDRSNC